MLDKLDSINQRFLEVEKLISSPNAMDDMKFYVQLSKEYKDLEPIIEIYKIYSNLLGNISEAKEIISSSDDPEMKEMAKMELDENLPKVGLMEEEIKLLLIPKDPQDSKNAVMEIRAGTGGDEAALFSGDLYRMYSRLSERNNWKMEVVNVREGDHGGFKELVTRIEGSDVYKQLKFEAGVHRVQRVPTTESQGRVHTSACSVAVLAQQDDLTEVNIDKNDLRVDTFRASGAGGQHVNKTDSAVRLTHIPTGIVVECQDGRSQHKNKEKALSLLQSKLQNAEKEKAESEQAENRRVMVGSGDRSEKIRTYNFPQNRITDHRIEFSVHNLPAFLDGDMEVMISALLEENQARALANLES